MKYCLLSLFFLLSLLNSQAATPVYILSGKVTDKSGEPVTYATISLDKTRYVGVANLDGDFSINIPAGNYNGEVSAVGRSGIHK